MKSKLNTYRDILSVCDAVLYDFDEILVASEYYYYLSWKKIFARMNHPLNAREYWEYWASYGVGLKGEIKRHGLTIPPRLQKLLIDEQQTLYREHIKNKHIFGRNT